MTHIKHYSQNSTETPKKGSLKNPYTKEEFNEMILNGTWSGGFVENLGYCLPTAIIQGNSYSTSFSFSNDSYSNYTENFFYDSYSEFDLIPYETQEENSNNERTNQSSNPSSSPTNPNIPISNNQTSPTINHTTPKYNDVLSPNNFRGFKPSDRSGCFNRCKEMLATANCQPNGKEIVMVKSSPTGRSYEKSQDFEKGIAYLNNQLKKLHPVIVAVDYKKGHSTGEERDDKSGDHFIVIVGGNDKVGYHFFDPATSSTEKGTNQKNILIFKNGIFIHKHSLIKDSTYRLSSIRENTSIK